MIRLVSKGAAVAKYLPDSRLRSDHVRVLAKRVSLRGDRPRIPHLYKESIL